MENLNFDNLQPFIFILIGFVCIFYSIFKKNRNESLKSSGEKADGIIFRLDCQPNSSQSFHANIKDKVTIRFVTKDQTSVTEPIKQDFAIFYSNQYKECENLDVYYDPQNPSKFYVDTKQSERIGRLIIAAVGLVFISIGVYQTFF